MVMMPLRCASFLRIGRRDGDQGFLAGPRTTDRDVCDGTILSLLRAWSVVKKDDNIHGGGTAAHINEVGLMLRTKPARELMQLRRKSRAFVRLIVQMLCYAHAYASHISRLLMAGQSVYCILIDRINPLLILQYHYPFS